MPKRRYRKHWSYRPYHQYYDRPWRRRPDYHPYTSIPSNISVGPLRFFDEMKNEDNCIISITLGENTERFKETADLAIEVKDIKSMLDILAKAMKSCIAKKFNQKIADILFTNGYLISLLHILVEKSRLTENIEGEDVEGEDEIITEAENLADQILNLLSLLTDICKASNAWHTEITLLHKNITSTVKNIRNIVAHSRFIVINDNLKSLERQVKCADERNLDYISKFEIFPKECDIERESFTGLSKNVTNGSYKSRQNYLNIHFHLLREDFITPLREGIHELRDKLQSNRFVRRVNNLRVYHNVRTSQYYYKDGEKSLELVLYRHAKFRASSDRLKYGTLIGLSTDSFQTYQFAMVLNNKDLQTNGKIEVIFQSLDDDLLSLERNNVMMIEPTSGYFTSYRHTLEVLQKLSRQQSPLPLEKYIVFCEKEIGSPKYLVKDDTDLLNHFSKQNESCSKQDDFRSISASKTENTFCSSSADINLCKEATCNSVNNSNGSVKIKTTTQTEVQDEEEFNLQLLDQTSEESDDDFRVLIGALKRVNNATEELNSVSLISHTESSRTRSFDRFQLEAFQTAISKEISVIQGPPGCGKTFLGLAIIEHIWKKTHLRSLGHKILIVSYTNHALDQFLEGLFATYKSHMIRVGNRSKSLAIQSLTIKEKRVHLQKTKGENNLFLLWKSLKDERETLSNELNKVIQKTDILLNNIINVDTLAKETGPFYKLFDWCKSKTDEKGNSITCQWLLGLEVPEFQNCNCYNFSMISNIMNRHIALCLQCDDAVKLKHVFLQKLSETPIIYNNELNPDLNILNPSFPEDKRLGLYRGWIENYCSILRAEKKELLCKLKHVNSRVTDIGKALDKQVIQKSSIIGMTTSSAAEHWDILQDIQPTVIIAEESAEVLESHLLASFSPGCQQLILIGDHKQLRPKPSVNTLAKDYGLEISMFERLVLNDIHCTQLRVQHRMRTEISENLKSIYKNLKDHNSVKRYEDICGVCNNLFWIDHTFPENAKGEMESYKNKYEAMYLVSLCNYLLSQGYRSDEITILTFYKGQMFLIREEAGRELKARIRVDTVDNFQGEENKIILLSLVRSNKEGRSGFTNIENRICVALSRAKQGLYIMGNSKTICKRSVLWKEIYQKMKRKKLVSEALRLVCSNHPDQTLDAKTADDFSKWSYGGCTLPCKTMLSCGHTCPETCHTACLEHSQIPCKRYCLETCKRGHKCKRKCFEPCSIADCKEKVQLLLDQCDHVLEIICSMNDDMLWCERKCRKILPCGHSCNKECYKTCLPCEHLTEILHEHCGHFCNVACKFTSTPVDCKERCNVTLSCGHVCAKLCFDRCTPCMEKVIYKRSCVWRLSCAKNPDMLTFTCGRGNLKMQL